MFDIQGTRGEFLKILADVGEEPAFIQRARSVEIGWDLLISRCQTIYEELLLWPRRHLMVLSHRLRGDWSRLLPFLENADEFVYFESLHCNWKAKLSVSGGWAWSDRGAFLTFVESVDRFNKTWLHSLRQVDLEAVNRVRGDYNRFYPTEKDCAFGVDRTYLTFRPIEMVSLETLLERFPLISLPKLR
jgi:hypothetical protein